MSAVYRAVLWFRWILTAEISREEADRELKRWNQAVEPPIRSHFDTPVVKTSGRQRRTQVAKGDSELLRPSLYERLQRGDEQRREDARPDRSDLLEQDSQGKTSSQPVRR